MDAEPANPAALIAALRSSFAAHADAAQAAAMQAYMKSAMPFHGIAAPLRRKLMAEAVRAHVMPDVATLADAMSTLWHGAQYREERYAAAELARTGAHRRLMSLALLPVFEAMITTGAWWDYCDEISANGIAPLLRQHPLQVKPRLRQWAVGGDLWLRRAAMLSQRKLKGDAFDAVLFYDTIMPSIGSGPLTGEFFIRKAIGWALRERSYAAPQEVRAFCREYEGRLSPLTRREALKVIGRESKRARS